MKEGVSINGETRLYGVLGHPVKASLSPPMQNTAFSRAGLNSVYLAFPVDPKDLPQAVKGLVAAGIAGFNLTVPHKTDILPLLHETTPQALKIGAVNTVRVDEGKLYGTNTDGDGFLSALKEELDWEPAGKSVLMLGAGGAARGIAYSLLAGGAKSLTIANRTKEKAVALAETCQTWGASTEINALALNENLPPADLLINTTTAGMGDGLSPIDLNQTTIKEALADIIYSPATTPLMTQAKTAGLPTINGLGMLLHQGALAFEFWTNQKPDIPKMRQALNQALEKRGF